MADKNTASWKLTAAALIWIVVAIWIVIALMGNALGAVLGALSFGAIASMLLAGFSTSDVNRL